MSSHGVLAAERAVNCATCHDRSTCTTCHGGATHVPDAVLEIPEPTTRWPSRGQKLPGCGYWIPLYGFRLNHSAAASTGQMSCMTCHSENTCLECHDGMSSPAVSSAELHGIPRT